MPKDDVARLWRYMDLPKLVSLLSSSQLYLARADLMDDAFEGSFSAATLRRREEAVRGSHPNEDAQLSMRTFSRLYEENRRETFLSCWHMSDIESMAMWGNYVRKGEGIAITTTVARLLDELSPFEPFIEYGEVRYIDYDREAMPDFSGFYPYFFKRRSFEHEREFRAVAWTTADAFRGQDRASLTEDGMGVRLPLDPKNLIEKLYVAPGASVMYADCVNAIVEKFCPGIAVDKSAIDARPLF